MQQVVLENPREMRVSAIKTWITKGFVDADRSRSKVLFSKMAERTGFEPVEAVSSLTSLAN